MLLIRLRLGYDQELRPPRLPTIIGNEFRVLCVHERSLSYKLEGIMFVLREL